MQPKTNSQGAYSHQRSTTGQRRCIAKTRIAGVSAPTLDQQIQACLGNVDSPALRQFLASVVKEPEVLEVLARPVSSSRTRTCTGIEIMKVVALAIRQQSPFGRVGRDVVYVGALLHGVQYFVKSCIVGNADLNDVMFTIVRGPLHKLDDADPGSASLLRLCLGWGNSDETVELAEQVQQMLLRTSRSIDRVAVSTKGA